MNSRGDPKGHEKESKLHITLVAPLPFLGFSSWHFLFHLLIAAPCVVQVLGMTLRVTLQIIG
jgi:hypothetical protein